MIARPGAVAPYGAWLGGACGYDILKGAGVGTLVGGIVGVLGSLVGIAGQVVTGGVGSVVGAVVGGGVGGMLGSAIGGGGAGTFATGLMGTQIAVASELVGGSKYIGSGTIDKFLGRPPSAKPKCGCGS